MIPRPSRLTYRHPCGWYTRPGNPCMMHPQGCPTESEETLRTPMGLDAPAGAVEDYDPAKQSRLEAQVRNLKARVAARDADDTNKFDLGVEHGRREERREIAARLDRNAAALSGNGTAHDPVVRLVLRTLARQLRAQQDRRDERTG